ncbi:MAG: hypothetical protein LBH16_02515 [Treponema sp.]|jgi:hypothetical protein|nr:hypothetical protein [Treponema sp.]
MKYFLFFSFVFLFILPSFSPNAVMLPAQEQSASAAANAVVSAAVTEEPRREFSYIGLKLPELIERLGAPKSVSAARGNELWQDDVVFQYNEGDFFIFKDRVWQVKFTSAYGISPGDPKQAVLLVLGESAEDKGDHLILPVQSKDWPLMIRVNLNSAGRAASIFIYRPDF